MQKKNIKRRSNDSLDLSIKKKHKLTYNRIYGEGGSKIINTINSSAANSWKSASGIAGNIGGIASTLGTFVDTWKNNAEIADTAHIESNISDLNLEDFSTANDSASLEDAYGSLSFEKDNYIGADVRGGSTGERIGNTVNATVSGFTTGLSTGGIWGGIAGAVGGLASGIGGWLSGNKKAEEKAAELNRLAEEANNRAQNSFNSQALSVAENNFRSRMANIAALGGPIFFSDGGGIHIKKKNRGKFTASAKKAGMGVQEYAKHILANKEKYSPTLVKRANFARNASKWKHALGGYLFTHGGDWTNGLSTIDTGGTHEQNLYEGVPMGIAPDGQPNLVEQGEVIFNDYVFSNRLHPSEKELEKANLPKRYKGHTFALIAEDMGKESSERPNDPISKRGLEDSMMKLAMVQEAQRARKGKKGTQQMMAFGGRKYAGDGDNPPTGFTPWDPKGTFKNFPYKYPFETEEVVYLPGEAAPVLTRTENTHTESSTPASKTTASKASEPVKRDMELVPKMARIEDPGFISDSDISHTYTIDDVPRTVTGYKIPTGNLAKGTQERVFEAAKQDAVDRGLINENSLPTYLRYAPVLGSALGALHSVFQKPDYTNSDILMSQANNLSRRGVTARTLGNYLTYRPLDRNYYLNQLKGQAGATRRAIMNSGSNPGQVMANLLAADYNAQNAVGNTLMKMEQYNDAQRQRVAEFNRGTDMANSQGFMQADQANAQIAQNRDRLRSSLMTQAAQMREAADTALEATRSANLTNFFDNLGGIGRENMGWNWTKYLADSGAFGNLREGYPAPGMGKDGGLLTKRNRRRR